jgi:SAM-dependent methyltransferase
VDYINEQAGRWDRWATAYDEEWKHLDCGPMADFLQNIVEDGRALELGAGTGRVALTLAGRSIEVDGIELSENMARVFQQKAGDLPVRVIVGDMTTAPVRGTYRLIYCVFNSFLELLRQRDQVACMKRAASVLSRDGRLVMETMAGSGGGALITRQQVGIRSIGDDHLSLSTTMTDPATQHIRFQEVRLTEAGIRLLPVTLRYVWPSELDLMAEIAGLSLMRRYSSWHGAPFDGNSRVCISVYGRDR